MEEERREDIRLRDITLDDDAFVKTLSDLTKIHTTPRDDLPVWHYRERISSFIQFYPRGRHQLAAMLHDADWPRHQEALRKAVRDGATFILAGEDVNIDPKTGLAIWPHNDGRQLPALAVALKGARWNAAAPDGASLVARLGKGRVILSRESIDMAVFGEPNKAHPRAHKFWLSRLRASGALGGEPSGKRIKAPSARALAEWWAGRRALLEGERTISWFRAAHQTAGGSFELLAPPTGEIAGVRLELSLSEAGTARIDVGRTNEFDLEVAFDKGDAAQTVDLTEAVTKYLAELAAHHIDHRDGNARRVIPVRVAVARGGYR